MTGYRVNRLEVIDHTAGGKGRALTRWVDRAFIVELVLQDDDRTLKVFLSDPEGDDAA